MFIALVCGRKGGDGLGILGFFFCIAHVQIVTLTVNDFSCKGDRIGTGRLGGG